VKDTADSGVQVVVTTEEQPHFQMRAFAGILSKEMLLYTAEKRA